MSTKFEIHPSSIRTGIPITVLSTLPGRLKVTRLDRNERIIEAPLSPRGSAFEIQLSLSFAGNYLFEIGTQSQMIEVEQQKDLGFLTEFGIFSFAVFILVGGMLLWLKKQKATSASLSGRL